VEKIELGTKKAKRGRKRPKEAKGDRKEAYFPTLLFLKNGER
jgi:hypothetical protein